jgi:hypothetical protein
MSTITRLLARATGPGRCRTTLRQQTRAVRRYRAAFAALGRVQTTWPRGVLGGDILDLLSDRLRAMLDVEAASGPMLRVDPTARARLLSPPFAPQDNRDVFLTQPPAGQTGPFNVVGVPYRREARAFPPPTRHNGRRNESSRYLLTSFERRRTTQDSSRLQLSGHRELAPASRTTPPGPYETAGEPVFTRKIHEYWRLTAEAERQQTPPGTPALAPHDERHLPDVSNLPGQAFDTFAWPEMTGRELAARLQAFAAGQGFAPAPVPRDQEPTPSQAEDGVGMFKAVPTACTTDSANALHVLSEGMAMILRDQALHHGIDLT